MPVLELETPIASDLETCFDLSRSIDLHKLSTSRSKEVAIGGRTGGLIGPGESVQWRATHLGVRQNLTTRIGAYSRPHHFRDEQTRGAFRHFRHDHFFQIEGNGVVMRDVLDFQSPLGILGKLFDRAVLVGHLTRFLEERNAVIKRYAESGKAAALLGP